MEEKKKEREIEPEEPEQDLFPQIQIINGEIVLNQDSITIKRPEINFEKDYERINESQAKKFTSATYARHPRTPAWTKDETQKFYNALSQLGTNFSQISQFFPNRDRRQIRNKFKKEEKENKLKVENYLKNRKPLNLEAFLQISKETLEERLREKEEREKKKKEEDKEEEWDTIEGETVTEKKVIDEGEYVDTGESFVDFQEEDEEDEFDEL
jgi:transcription factor TFIIIB component B''